MQHHTTFATVAVNITMHWTQNRNVTLAVLPESIFAQVVFFSCNSHTTLKNHPSSATVHILSHWCVTIRQILCFTTSLVTHKLSSHLLTCMHCTKSGRRTMGSLTCLRLETPMALIQGLGRTMQDRKR